MASQSRPFSPPPPYSSYTDIPILAIAILGILTTAILLLSYYIFVIKCCMNWRQSEFLHHLFQSHSTRGRNNHSPSPFTIYASTTRTTNGLGESAIRAIPIIRFEGITKDQGCGSKKRFIQECSVCLSEFKDVEWLRILPNCSHAFHVDCIDTWLQTNSNCPFCRSEITDSDKFMSCEDQSVSVVIDVEADVNTSGSFDLAPRTEASVASTAAQQNLPLRRLENEFEFGGKKVRKLNQVCSMGDECINVREKDEDFCSLHPIRRSISMDSSTDRQLYVAVQEILRQKQNLELEREEGSSSGSFRIRTLFGSCRS